MINVLIADDHEMVRKGIKGWLEAEPDIAVVAETAAGSEVLELIEQENPDVVMLDLHMRDQHGLEVIKDLRSRYPKIPILVMTGYERQRARAVFAAGANGFMNKEESRDDLIAAVRWAADGAQGTWLGPTAAKDWLAANAAIDAAGLSRAELKVLELLDLSNAEISERLFLSEGTVKNHVSVIYTKLQLTTRAAAIEWAKKHGVLMR